MYFTIFTNYFFYFFVIYNYFRYKFPEKTQDFLIFVSYNFIYFYSKLQIILNKNKHCTELYNKSVIIYTNVKNMISQHFYKSSPINSELTIDFILNNEITKTFDTEKFLNIFCSKETMKCLSVPFDYDFVIFNGDNNMKKVTKQIETQDNFIDIEVFNTEPLSYKPILCEVIIKDNIVKIDLCDNSKGYNFLVLNNCLDKLFFTYFMKKYYYLDISEDYTIKILDHNITTHLFNSSETIKFEKEHIINNY
jgi:hypothetical protein